MTTELNYANDMESRIELRRFLRDFFATTLRSGQFVMALAHQNLSENDVKRIIDEAYEQVGMTQDDSTANSFPHTLN